jgi:hypothetical protein
MAQSNLKSDAYCLYNQAAAPLEWTLQKGQYYNTFPIGSVGVFAASNFVRPDVINIDSFLSGRDDILSKCNPPLPALDDANEPVLHYQNQENLNLLQPIYSREKRSAVNLSAVTYIPLSFSPELFQNVQNPKHIIFEGQAQRGGLNTDNLVKSAYNTDSCSYFLDPQRACGKECSAANGYFTRMPYSNSNPEAKWGTLPKGLPNEKTWITPMATKTQIGQADKPQIVTSQLVASVGAADDGPMMKHRVNNHGDPYAPLPHLKNPFTGEYYYSNPFSTLLAK